MWRVYGNVEWIYALGACLQALDRVLTFIPHVMGRWLRAPRFGTSRTLPPGPTLHKRGLRRHLRSRSLNSLLI